MNLNSSLQSMLDTPTKAFEVALRCFVADNLLCQYPDEQSLKDEIQKRIEKELISFCQEKSHHQIYYPQRSGLLFGRIHFFHVIVF